MGARKRQKALNKTPHAIALRQTFKEETQRIVNILEGIAERVELPMHFEDAVYWEETFTQKITVKNREAFVRYLQKAWEKAITFLEQRANDLRFPVKCWIEAQDRPEVLNVYTKQGWKLTKRKAFEDAGIMHKELSRIFPPR